MRIIPITQPRHVRVNEIIIITTREIIHVFGEDNSTFPPPLDLGYVLDIKGLSPLSCMYLHGNGFNLLKTPKLINPNLSR